MPTDPACVLIHEDIRLLTHDKKCCCRHHCKKDLPRQDKSMSLSSCTRYIHVMEQLRQSSGSMTRPRWDAPIMLYRMGAVVPGLLNSTMRQIAWTPVLVNMRPIIRPTILADTRITRDGHGNAISGRNIARCIMVCVSRKRTPYPSIQNPVRYDLAVISKIL